MVVWGVWFFFGILGGDRKVSFGCVDFALNRGAQLDFKTFRISIAS